jgi:hypothetical protein
MPDGGLIFQVAGILVAAGAVYGGIRNDLRGMHERQDRLERSIDKAHERIDDCTTCAGRRRADK